MSVDHTSPELKPGNYWKLGVFEKGKDGIPTQTINYRYPKNAHYHKIEVHGDDCVQEATAITNMLNTIDKLTQDLINRTFDIESFTKAAEEQS